MNKILKVLLPSLIIPLLICLDHFFMPDSSKFVLLWIYIVFPLIFIVQGIICSKPKRDMLIGFLLSAVSVILSTSIAYNMSSMIIPVIIYLLLGLSTSLFRNRK